jgi:hypothetical protein
MSRTICAWTAVLCCLPAASASGQDAAVHSYPVLFGRSVSNPDARQTLDASATVGEAYDDDLNADLAGRPVAIDTGGFYNSASGEFAYSLRTDRLQVGVTGTAAVRYYDLGHRFVNLNDGAGAGVSARLSPRTTLWVNGSAAYAPVFLYGLFATGAPLTLGQVVSTPTSYDVDFDRSFGTTASVRVAHHLTSRAEIAVGGDLRTTEFMGQSRLPDMISRGGNVQFSYGTTRNTQFRLAYRHTRARYTDFVTKEHDFDIGFDLNKRLSATRTATVSVTFGSALVDDPAILPAPPDPNADDRQYRMSADVALTYPVTRTWRIRTSFHRGVGYIEGLSAPVYTDAFGATVGGYLNPRIELTVVAGYSDGNWYVAANRSDLNTYTANARVQVALTRSVATYVEYLYYVYRFGGSAPLASAPPGLTRNGVRGGLALWLPLLRR